MRARLLEFRELAPTTRHFVFDLPDVEQLVFTPGQFLSFTAEIKGRMITRAYSIASAPGGNRFELCLNLVEGGLFSPLLFALEPGGSVECRGPYGVFTLRQPPADSILVATGTGIAPFRAMLRHQLPRDPDHRFTLVFGVRHEFGLLYRPELEALAQDYANFDFRPTLTRPTNTWTGRTGRVHAHLFEALGDRQDVRVYVCGLKEMVNEARTALKAKGLDRGNIILEKYD